MNRNLSLDILKIILALMIICLHTSWLADFTTLGNHLTTQGIFRIAVPVFVIINGYYFYNTTLTDKNIDWFKRVVYLYLFWMLSYSYFWFTLIDISFLGIFKFISRLFFGWAHLWYLPGIIGAAILTILFKNLSLRIIILIIFFTFVSGVVIQYAKSYHIFESALIDPYFNTTWMHRNFLLFIFPFFMIGFLINKYNLDKIITFKFSIIITFLGFILLTIESYLNYKNPICDGMFDNYISLIIVSPFLFILFLKLNIKGYHGKKIALYSSAIYFIHPIFLAVNKTFFLFEEMLLTLFMVLSSLIASVVLIKINTKIKFII